MRKYYIYIILLHMMNLWVNYADAQCTTSNGTGCICPDGSSNCLLLPDMVVSETAITEAGGTLEYSQNGNTSFNGQLRVTGATPNIGYGPLHILATDTFYCGTNKIVSATPPALCTDGTFPRQVIRQRIYRKDTTAISTFHVRSGIMSYHGSGHDHFHVEDWFHLSLRIKDSLEPDPRKWQIVGETKKISFCLADFDECTQANGYCRDSSGQVLDSANIPNFGMGANYNFCITEQGISPGYMDIYDITTPGQSMNIPYGTCNGKYWLVAEVDPLNFIVEFNEENNIITVPITLTKQSNVPSANISSLQGNVLCQSTDTITLKASAGSSYLWSTGDTTRSILVHKAGNYAVNVTTLCGNALSDTFAVKKINSPVIDSLKSDTLCDTGSALLSAYSKDNVYWYNEKDSLIYTGNNLSTPIIDTTRVFYASAFNYALPDTFHVGKLSKTSNGSYYPGTDYMRFNCYSPVIIKSVKVYADSGRFRTFRLWDTEGNELSIDNLYVPAGENRIELNFPVKPGNDYKLLCQTPELWRDQSLSFPYSLPNIIELIGAGLDNYYPYLYDWEIVTDPGSCMTVMQVDAKQQVRAYVGNKTPLGITGLDSAYFNTDPMVSINGIPSGGIFSGPGISGATFDPAAADSGMNKIVYTYTDNFGCTDSINMQVIVKTISSVQNSSGLNISKIKTYPNPSSGIFVITSEGNDSFTIVVYDKLGKQVAAEKLSGTEKKKMIDMTECSAGIYMAHISNTLSSMYIKLVLTK
ncbi:MAG: T9SS type A sorting domain-containing protein [Bacteroidetes bacterium]|nr:T9SS type A sorting domain-containing protein [Bacteroidota bacterium]